MVTSVIPCWAMSKDSRAWKIDEAQLLPPIVQDYLAKDYLSRLIVGLVREELDLSGFPAATGACSTASKANLGSNPCAGSSPG